MYRQTDEDDSIQLPDPTQSFTGFDLRRRQCSKLNRVRTECGKCVDFLDIYSRRVILQYDCGPQRQIMHHFVAAFYLNVHEFFDLALRLNQLPNSENSQGLLKSEKNERCKVEIDRPISIWSNVAKLFGLVWYNRIFFSHLERYGFLSTRFYKLSINHYRMLLIIVS